MKRIVLNIPHSRTLLGRLGWQGDIQPAIDRWTDWRTDRLFAPARHQQNAISPVIFPYSRFFVDVERLADDPLEEEGRGIVYTRFDGIGRKTAAWWRRYYDWHTGRLTKALAEAGPDVLLLDCHSFPSDLAPDVDICIGYNGDWSQPSEEILAMTRFIFDYYGFSLADNRPYANSFAPKMPFAYPSLMIEVNKGLYMDEESLETIPEGFTSLRDAILTLYDNLLQK